jgi:sulfide:quinone oxidoreductase
MKITPLNSTFSVAPQIENTDLEALAELGFKTIINNRPDNEQTGQPLSKSLEKAAQKAGIEYFHIPVIPGKATASDIAKFGSVLESCNGPVLGFCKSGMRAKSMYETCQPKPKRGLMSKLLGKK